MKKKPPITDDELAVFQQALKGVKPLKQKQIRQPLLPSRPSPIKRTPIEPEGFYFDETADLPTVSGETFIKYQCSGISNKILRNLRKGQYNVEAILDLHGMSIEEAQIAVNHFLQHCLETKVRVALIIHGKGRHKEMPILKNKLNHWLRRIPVILAFCSAAATHGSRGAIYVLFRARAMHGYKSGHQSFYLVAVESTVLVIIYDPWNRDDRN